jgi:predicted rRNA methylase YqxC with S4 and FtsJ domains
VQKKRRLDDVCRDLVPEYSMNVIRSFILSGKVFVNDQKVTKAGHQVRKKSQTTA